MKTYKITAKYATDVRPDVILTLPHAAAEDLRSVLGQQSGRDSVKTFDAYVALNNLLK